MWSVMWFSLPQYTEEDVSPGSVASAASTLSYFALHTHPEMRNSLQMLMKSL